MEDSSKSFIRFIPESLDFIPKKGSGWTPKIKRILLFELNIDPNRVDLNSSVDLSLIIGPGPQEIREKLHDIARRNFSLFNKCKHNLPEKWITISKQSMLGSKEFEDEEVEEIRELLVKKLKEFKGSDLPEIEKEIKKFNEHSV